MYPDGLRKQLNQFRTDYGNPKIIITENGCMDTKGEWLNDVSRIEYIREHMIAVSKGMSINLMRTNHFLQGSIFSCQYETYIET